MYPSILMAVADDSLCATLLPVLESAGYTVASVADGAAALDHLRLNLTRKRPHRLVVLVSQTLPVLDGIAMLQAIATDPHLANHHAYILLTNAEDATASAPTGAPGETAGGVSMIPSFPTLRVAVVGNPVDPTVLLTTIAHSTSTLGMGSEGDGRRD